MKKIMIATGIECSYPITSPGCSRHSPIQASLKTNKDKNNERQ